MDWLHWRKGRQNTGYEKMLLFQSKLLMCDMYLLWYAEGSSIPVHTDPVPGYRHFRLNVVLRSPQAGGEFESAKTLINTKRIKLFRSDFPHSVTEIRRGSRLLLSIGLCIR